MKMKKFLTILILLTTILFNARAQNPIPNPSFENWSTGALSTTLTPDSWNCGAMSGFGALFAPGSGCIQQTSQANTGSYAALLTGESITFMGFITYNIPGVMQLGSSNLDGMSSLLGLTDFNIEDFVTGGIPFTEVPEKLNAWIKFIPDGNDTMRIFVLATHWNGTERITVASGEYTNFNSIANYTQVQVPINTLVAGVSPDTLNVIFTTATNTTASANTQLYVDDVDIIMHDSTNDVYNITVIPNDATMGTTTGSGSYNYNSTVTISATANPGYFFVNWNDGITDNPRQFPARGDATYTANFIVDDGVHYNINVSSNNNAWGTATGGGSFPINANLTLRATPNPGHSFSHWSDNVTSPVRNITVTGDADYTAFFVQDTFTITATAYIDLANLDFSQLSMGSVSGGGSYFYGDIVTLTATPFSGYRFVQWSDGVTTNPRTETVTGDATYMAMFVGIDYTITAVPDDPTQGSVSGGGTFTYGSTTSLYATPGSAAYQFDHWNDGNTQNPRTITVTSDSTFTAFFSTASYTITVVSNMPNMGTASGGGTFPYNSTTTISANANAGYHFTNWSDGNTSNPRTITVTSNMTYYANFAADVAITENNLEANIFPNPATDVISIKGVQMQQIEIFDVSGKLMGKWEVAESNNLFEINLSNYPSGIYAIRITTGDGIIMKKIAKK